MNRKQTIKWIAKPLVILTSLVPLLLLGWDFYQDQLSANPISDITKTTGIWALRFLVITLGITPLVKISGWGWLAQFRRMVGLFAFFYALLHFSTYLVLDQFFDWESIVADISKRPYITIGFASFVLLIPLAVTSFNKTIKWMGSKRWNALHKLVYGIALGGVIHYLWLVKADKQRPLIYGTIVILLLGTRLFYSLKKRRAIKIT